MSDATNFDRRIRAIGDRISDIRERKARAEAKLEELAKRRAELIEQSKALGFDPGAGEDVVGRMRAEAAKLEKQADKELAALEEELGL